MSIAYGGDRITFSDGSTVGNGWTGFKNRIINGDMSIDQRNAGASVTVSTSTAYTLDRWRVYATQNSRFSVQQNAGSVTPPAGFTNYLGVTSLSSYSVLSSDYFNILTRIEGFNSADLGWGTSNAQTITLSFWVRSSLTGTFGGNLTNGGFTRSYPFSYTINTANTWEQKTITIVGDITGTWATNNGMGIEVQFGLGVGSASSGTANTWQSGWIAAPTGATSVVGTNGATFYITGVQLEKGSTATSFDYLPYGTELALCRRYFKFMPALQGNFVQGLNVFIAGAGDAAQTMRATPTGAVVNGTNGIHVSNVANYNVTSLNDINNNYFRVNTNSNPGSNVPGHYNTDVISLNAEL